MQITITLDSGITRTFQGDPDTLQNKNWNETIYKIIEDGIDSKGHIANF